MALGLVAHHLSRLGTLSATSDHASVVSINIFVALLCGCIVIGRLLEESRWINESFTALVIGVCTGAVILLTTKGKSLHIFVFSEDLFFSHLLPSVIFNAGGNCIVSENGYWLIWGTAICCSCLSIERDQ